MENPDAEEADDLEIASIGSLYVGRWDKKYWSSSRGKDRYPYPVGYRAIRTHSCSICQMEIFEGLKGPLFVITAVDGSSFSGQTPDIAWENFQRSCPKVKNWNGKRSSNKIDGAELFGLKNPSVQRLLRNLVNSVNIACTENSVSPLFCNAPKNMDQAHPEISEQNPKLLSALEEQDISGKKTRKRNASKDIMGEARLKKVCNLDLLSDSKTLIVQQISYPCLLSPDCKAGHLITKRITSSRIEDSASVDIASHISTSPNDIMPPTVHVKPSVQQYQRESEIISFANCYKNEATDSMMPGAQEVNCHSVLASNGIPIRLDSSDYVVDKHIVSQQTSNCADIETYVVASGLDKRNSAINILIDRCSGADIEVRNSILSAPNKDYGELMALASSSDVCISDNCDTVVGGVLISALDHSNDKNDLVAANPLSRKSKFHSLEVMSKSEFRSLTSRSSQCPSEPRHLMPNDPFDPGRITENAIFQGMAKDSLPEVGCSGSSGGVEEVDMDLAGQELAKSMMAFLLPQAVPLLKKTYSRRRSRTKIVEDTDLCCSLTRGNTANAMTVNDHLNNIRQGKIVDETLAQLPEKTIQESIDASKTSSQVADFTEFNLYSASEPFSEYRSSKDAMAVIPDSFENDICSVDALIKEHSFACFNESALAQDDVKGNSDTSSLPITVAEEVKKLSQKDTYNHKDLTPVIKYDSVNSIIVVEPTKYIPQAEEVNEDPIKSIAKYSGYSNHLSENFSSLDSAFVMQNNFQCSNDESELNTEEVSIQVTPANGPDKDENSEHKPPASCHILDNLTTNNLSAEAHQKTYRSIKEKSGSYSHVGVVNFGAHKDNKGEQVSEKENHSLPCMPTCVLVTEGISINTIETQSFNGMLPAQCNAPLSETLLCRNLNNSKASCMHFSRKSISTADNYQSSHIYSRMLPVYEAKIDEQKNNLINDPNASEPEAIWLIPPATAFQSEDLDRSVTGITEATNQAQNSSLCLDKGSKNAVSQFSMPGTCSLLQVTEGIQAMPELNRKFTHTQLHSSYKNSLMDSLSCFNKSTSIHPATNNCHSNLSHGVLDSKGLLDGLLAKGLKRNEGDKQMELVGCYLHPEPILSVTFRTNNYQLQLCVLCGFPREINRYLFMYTVSIHKQRGCPTFLGYTPLLLPIARSRWNINIPFERSALQLAPNGQSLIFVSSIKAPRCREQKFSCFCSNCKPESSKGTTVEIVHVNFGYVSRIIKLTTVREISCISVCDPIYLIAVEENRVLHAWVMNLLWSDNLEEFMLPAFDCISPMIVELKGIPNCNSLIIGHNGLGDFGLWELSKRVLLAKFSSPGSTIYQMIPVSAFNWQRNATFTSGPQSAEHIMGNMQKTNFKTSLSSFEDIAVWVLVSAADFETEFEVEELGKDTTGLWRLALMTKNIIIMGSILDPSATAVDASADTGILGTIDGMVYKWELSSGRKLEILTSIQCGVACVALDGETGALAVAGRDGGLQVFIES